MCRTVASVESKEDPSKGVEGFIDLLEYKDSRIVLSSELSSLKSTLSDFGETSELSELESHSVTKDCNSSQWINRISLLPAAFLSSGSKFSHIRSQYVLHTSSVSIDVLDK